MKAKRFDSAFDSGKDVSDVLNVSKARRLLQRDTEHAVQAFARRVADEYDLLGAVLFGSRAGHGYRPDSDADLAVLLRGERGPRIDVALRLADIAFEVMLETGILIDAIPFWEEEWAHPERFANPALIENIRREGVCL
jgi:predicted nucleotidyltransferase